LKTICPACGALSSLDALLGHEGARAAVMVALAMPAPVGRLLVQYLGLFRPRARQLSFDRVANLLDELLPMIAAAKIARNGRIWSAPQDYWTRALQEMLDKRDQLTLPLKSHGYLLAIIEGYSNKAEAQAEQQHEDRKAGRTQIGGLLQPLAPSPGLRPPSPGGESVARGAKPVGGEGTHAAPAQKKTRNEMPESVRVELEKFTKKGVSNG